MKLSVFAGGRMSTAIQQITAPGATARGKFIIVGSVPATCMHDNGRGQNCRIFNTEQEALDAILADPWIQATPDQMIQLNDCSKVDRKAALQRSEIKNPVTLALFDASEAL